MGRKKGREIAVKVFQTKEKRGLSPLFFLCAWAMACSLLLGGGASNIYLTNALLQILTLPTLYAALWRLGEHGPPATARPILYMIGAAVLLVVLQLVPLPPALWSGLPFRDRAVSALTALGDSKMWAPLSLSPELTITGALTALPPLSLFLGVISLNLRERRLLTLIALAFGVINAFIGLAQLSQGAESALYFYKFAGVGDSSGLFANRNHEAALLYSLTPFVAAWLGALAPALSNRDHSGKPDSLALINLAIAGVTAFVLIVATLMTRSRAGVILLMCALLGGLFLQPWRKLGQEKNLAGGVFIIVAILALIFGAQYGLYRIMMRFEEDPFADARVAIWQATAKAMLKALPFGTGLGSFPSVYASIERPADLLPNVFVNAAHNDLLQIMLETGAPGVALILGFCVWFLYRCRSSWRGHHASGQGPRRSGSDSSDPAIIDLLAPRAATLSIALLFAHSLVEFPLRTNALLGLFAFCCGLLNPPRYNALIIMAHEAARKGAAVRDWNTGADDQVAGHRAERGYLFRGPSYLQRLLNRE